MGRVRVYRSTERSEQYGITVKSADKLADKDAELQKAKRAAGELATEATAEIDELLDEIDGVLEQNAEEFVTGYVQRGGE